MPDAKTPERRWTFPDADEAGVRALAQLAGVSTVVARLLVTRGVTDAVVARRFLEPDIARDWRSPSSIPGMDACADEVADAVRRGSRIAVFGDFDADGVTATALLTAGLRRLGADVSPVLPHRAKDGYGLGPSSIERLLAESPALVVTVDCGISSAVEVEALLARGVRVVVTDHHEPGDSVPTGVPVADPKLPGAPFSGLAGAGVALKLLQAVGERTGQPDLWLDYTDIAAIGTIADVVPLLDENRALVAHGLERMRRDPRPGIAALASVAGIDVRAISAERTAFGLSPRINAAGRIADPGDALDLLLEEDPARAATLARRLDEYNRARQAVEADLVGLARESAEKAYTPGDRVLVLAGEGWHPGVRGIAAGRLASLYGVPVVLFTIEDGVATGSGRSAAGVDLHAAVSECAALLTRFGGHAAAVGVTLPAADVEAFRSRLATSLATLSEEAFIPSLALDAEVRLADVSRELAAELAALEPFGHSNPKPLLASRGVFMNGRKRVGADADHLRFEAYDGVASVAAIAFRCPDIDRVTDTPAAVDIAYQVDVETWKGRERLQLMVRDLRIGSAAPEEAAAALVDELFADADRILARDGYGNIADAGSFHTKLAGVTFDERQTVVGRLAPGAPLRLKRQADNPHDPNACALFDALGDHVGFFNRRLAAAIAPAIDAGAAYDVVVSEVTGGKAGESLGVNVEVQRRSENDDVDAPEDRAAARERLSRLPDSDLDAELSRRFIGDRPLHDAQVRSLAHLAAGRSCLTVMATGRGKSLIFQMHAARLALKAGRASIFVYPLRALVADQAFHLTETFAGLGLSAGLITGETPQGGRDETFAALADGRVDALMTTPEFLERHAERFAASGRVGFVVVDEAHHVGQSRTGHRPAYARMGKALETLGRPMVLAVTATAGDEEAAVIRATLGIDEMVLDPTVRDNLRVADRRSSTDKVIQLVSLAACGDKTIVYVNSREQSVRLAQKIRESVPALLHRAAFYNGGMARAARHAVERAFREGDLSLVVATSAFGEGVNIPDVRHVVLFHLPFDRVEFNQMCGRGGRDGEAATIHLLFGEKDARLNELIIEASAPDADDLRALYAALRDKGAAAEDGWVEATNADLAEYVRTRRQRSRLSDRGVSTGIGVFRELGFVTGEGLGAYRRLRLEPASAAKTDLKTSVRYAEGLQEAAEFAEFREWVLAAACEDLLATLNRPILPST